MAAILKFEVNKPETIALKPLCIDLFCGLGGWTEGFLAEGYDCVGFDIERHTYGSERYPAQLVLQDVLTLNGSQFKDAAIIVASPPCTQFSYRGRYGRKKNLPPPDLSLFQACFRIQREAIEAQNCTCGHTEQDHEHDYLNGDDECKKCSCIYLERRNIPLVVENVVWAQEFVGTASTHWGSQYLWGDIPCLLPFRNSSEGRKGDYLGLRSRSAGSKSAKRKQMTAELSKIPRPLSEWIARCYKPASGKAE